MQLYGILIGVICLYNINGYMEYISIYNICGKPFLHVYSMFTLLFMFSYQYYNSCLSGGNILINLINVFGFGFGSVISFVDSLTC